MTVYGPNNTPWVIKKGDTGKILRAQLRDSAGPVDLTGCLVRFLMRPVGANSPASNKVDAPAALVTPLTGEVKYEWLPVNIDTVGDYYAEFEVTFPTGNIMTWPTMRDVPKRYLLIRVQPTLD
jgi:hypothetical protein